MELITEVQLLIYKISVITGWKVPESQDFLTVLVEQFFKKIREDFAHLNSEEVEHAFRQNTQVKDWGKSFNLALVDEVLIPYMAKRREIKEFVERLPKQEKLLPMQADWKELVDLNYQQFLTGTYKMEVWPWQMYDECVKAGYIESAAYEDFLGRALNLIKLTTPENNQQAEKRKEIINAGINHPQVIEMAKRLSIKLLYITAKNKNYTHLFEKE